MEDVGEGRCGLHVGGDAIFDVSEVELLTEIWQARGVGSQVGG